MWSYIVGGVFLALAIYFLVQGIRCGAELGETVLRICFALVYGMVFALIFAESGSLLPCVLLHALHDFCAFISGEGSAQFEIILGAVQFIVLLVYFLYLFRITARKREPAMKGR